MSDNRTKLFQNDVKNKMSNYFKVKIEILKKHNEDEYNNLVNEYKKQYRVISESEIDCDIDKVLLAAVSEDQTCYYEQDYDRNQRIYSPRADIAFSPVIQLEDGKFRSIGINELTDDVKLYDLLHKLDFVKKIEKRIRQESNANLAKNMQYKIYPHCNLGIEPQNESNYVNKRPLHLFGIEIENQTNQKYLMGDFLNAISLARIPIVVVPEDNLIALIKMLKFCLEIRRIKEIYSIVELFYKVNILTIRQFRNILNKFLEEERLDLIEGNEYY